MPCHYEDNWASTVFESSLLLSPVRPGMAAAASVHIMSWKELSALALSLGQTTPRAAWTNQVPSIHPGPDPGCGGSQDFWLLLHSRIGRTPDPPGLMTATRL